MAVTFTYRTLDNQYGRSQSAVIFKNRDKNPIIKTNTIASCRESYTDLTQIAKNSIQRKG